MRRNAKLAFVLPMLLGVPMLLGTVGVWVVRAVLVATAPADLAVGVTVTSAEGEVWDTLALEVCVDGAVMIVVTALSGLASLHAPQNTGHVCLKPSITSQ